MSISLSFAFLLYPLHLLQLRALCRVDMFALASLHKTKTPLLLTPTTNDTFYKHLRVYRLVASLVPTDVLFRRALLRASSTLSLAVLRRANL